jgi:TrmH family RNA methyltransferase
MIKEIFSSQHPLVKHCVRLREERKYRYAKKRLLLSGKKQIRELGRRLDFCTLFVQQGHEVPDGVRAEQVFIVPEGILKKVTGQVSPEPVAAEVVMPEMGDLSGVKRLLILDGIADPGNLGTLMRTGLALQWDVFLTPGCTDPYHERALSAAKGALFKMAWRSGTWEELQILVEREGLTLVAADTKGEPLMAIEGPIGLVLGNEAHGVRVCARKISIPMGGEMESLNVAAAGAICMWVLK